MQLITVCGQIVKGIDALSREQLAQIVASFGIANAAPVFSMVPSLVRIRSTKLLPTVTEEDKIVINNVQKVVEFLTAGNSKPRYSDQVFFNYLSAPAPFLRLNRFLLYLFSEFLLRLRLASTKEMEKNGKSIKW